MFKVFYMSSHFDAKKHHPFLWICNLFSCTKGHAGRWDMSSQLLYYQDL